MAKTGRYAQYPSLQDKVVLITGGATGIGASMVEHFAAQGSRVAFLDVDESSAAKLIDDIASAKHAPVFLKCDLTELAALRPAGQDIVEHMAELIEKKAAEIEAAKAAEKQKQSAAAE